MTKRRTVVLALGACAVVVPLRVLAQIARPRRIGFLATYARAQESKWVESFKAGMRENGYAEGRDYVIEYRFADGGLDRLPALVSELVALRVDLIYAPATIGAIAAHNATHAIPIVISTSADPVGAGLASSLSHPGGNVTGLTALGGELIPKRLDMLRQILPTLKRVGFIYNPDSPVDAILRGYFESGAERLHIKAVPVRVRGRGDIDSAFQTLSQEKAEAVVASATIANVQLRDDLVEQAVKHRLPGMFGGVEFVERGGLISYSPDYADQYRRAAAYVDKIFKGAKPADLPIQQPVKFDLAVNLKTARTLGIEIPQAILLLADTVIE
jgi:putative ABC transport system substrate-binding protein